MWLPGACARPYMLYSPTEAEFDRITIFLLSEPVSQTTCALPILLTLDVYQRWDPAIRALRAVRGRLARLHRPHHPHCI